MVLRFIVRMVVGSIVMRVDEVVKVVLRIVLLGMVAKVWVEKVVKIVVGHDGDK